jgi:hypothetical protein
MAGARLIPAFSLRLELGLEGCRFFRQTGQDGAAGRRSSLFPPIDPRILGIAGIYILQN